MKICPTCNQTYTDETLNFCLSDGATLTKSFDEPAPTVFMNEARRTNPPSNWSNNDAFNPPNYEPMAPWQSQNQQMFSQNQNYLAANPYRPLNKSLPTISLVLGILGVVFCCYGFPLGISALVTGFIGFNNVKKDPMSYGGNGMAIAGMILGVISILELILVIIGSSVGK